VISTWGDWLKSRSGSPVRTRPLLKGRVSAVNRAVESTW
jgi:hypothetical protein